ncbi:MAG: hypothetical protein KGL44_10720 [Sphingomonadales bacterium]|nr:hypothetical protein [Sphingomonadales bacterium]
MTVAAPLPSPARLSIGVTGHRGSNPPFTANRTRIEAVLDGIFAVIDAATGAEPLPLAPTRLHSLLAEGVDQIAARAALSRGWHLIAPLPFGQRLNLAINAQPGSRADAEVLVAGAEPADMATRARAAAIAELTGKAHMFELAERDAQITALLMDKLDHPADIDRAQAFAAHSSERVALAGRVMIEQSDIIIGVWDGETTSLVGGTGHTIAAALELGAAVIWIKVQAPEDWTILRAPESLAVPAPIPADERVAVLEALVRAALRPPAGGLRAGIAALGQEAWHSRSSRWWTAYRRIEALFGGEGKPFRSLRQIYESPEAIATGSGAGVIAAAQALPGGDAVFAARIDAGVLQRFAWADGISAHLSDSYRGGMIANFLLSAAAVIAGIAYQPFATSEQKWMFAGVEFLLLGAILFITWLGGKRRWHRRWFETRRVAEYFRHAPIMLLLGVARAPGRWPRGADTAWPEYHARSELRALGLPRVAITPAYLRGTLAGLLDVHVVSQRDYHLAKAEKLTRVHHNLDHLSTRLFQLAVVSVAIYLGLKLAATLEMVPHAWPHNLSYAFTFMGVAFPTLGAAIAGMRYFGDFERFAAISEVTAEKLDAVHARLTLLLAAPDDALHFARAAELAHAADDIVVSEIENWQAVFGGKHITVPV